MALDDIHAVGERLLKLRAKLAAREGKAEYKDNVDALKAEIARIEASTSNPANKTGED